MVSQVILHLLALTGAIHLTDGVRVWGSRRPIPSNVWREGWQIDQSTYRDTNSVKADSNPDGSQKSVIAVHLAKGSYGLTGPNSGVEFYSAPVPPRKCLTLNYRVRFEDGFNFAYGGKLPGLYGGGVNCTAGTDPGKDCFTTRFIWRTGGVGALALFTQTEQHSKFCNATDVECNQNWGHRLATGFVQFETGKWYLIQQTVHLNTPGQADGYLRISVAGSRNIYEKRDISFRKSGTEIDGIYFSAFFGGTSSCSASPVDTHVFFRAFNLKDYGC